MLKPQKSNYLDMILNPMILDTLAKSILLVHALPRKLKD